MGKILILVLILIFLGLLWTLPLYLAVNLLFWVFHFPAHLTLLQSFAICLVMSAVSKIIFKNKGE